MAPRFGGMGHQCGKLLYMAGGHSSWIFGSGGDSEQGGLLSGWVLCADQGTSLRSGSP